MSPGIRIGLNKDSFLRVGQRKKRKRRNYYFYHYYCLWEQDEKRIEGAGGNSVSVALGKATLCGLL